MSMHFRELASKVAADGLITPDEILSLRRTGWSDGQITPEEAEAIFAINDAIDVPTNEWSDYFVEALGEFIINGVDLETVVPAHVQVALATHVCPFR